MRPLLRSASPALVNTLLVTDVASGFVSPQGLVVNADGTALYVADTDHSQIKKIDLTTGTPAVTVIAGTGADGYAEGIGDQASFFHPADLALVGDTLYVTDSGNNRVRSVELASGQTTLIAGSGAEAHVEGFGAEASFMFLGGIVAHAGALYVADRVGLHHIDLTTREVKLVTAEIGTESMHVLDTSLFTLGGWGWNRLWKLTLP